MKCSKCGQELSDNANFCRKCGSPTIRNKSYLVQRARENDQEALAEIYRISSPAVYRAIRILIKDEDTVYDILQDTYIKGFTRLDQLQNPERLVPWFKMIANNLAKDWLKKSKPIFFTDMSGGEELGDISFEESIEDERTDLNPEIAMDEKEVRRLVMEILDQLPEDQRMVIAMFYYEEMSVKDIAEVLGVSENTVKSRLSYGRKKIKEQVLDLEKRGTKLYSLAPFVFFLYLLGKVDKVSAEPLAEKAFPAIMESCFGKKFECTDISYSEDEMKNRSEGGNSEEHLAGENVETAKTDTVGTASKATAKTAGTVAGTAAKHAGLKIAAVVLAGIAGAGGITYGVMKNTDRFPFVHEQESDTQKKDNSSKEKKKETEKKETSTTPTEIPTKTPVSEKTPTEAPKLSEKEIYKTFYDGYVKDEKLQVIQNGFSADYDFNTGYQNDLLLSAYMEDFGGDGKEELLLVRTKAKQKSDDSSNYTEVERPIYLDLYGTDGQKAVLRQELEMPNTDVNMYLDSVREQMEVQNRNNAFYLYRYGMWTPGHGASDYFSTFIKITDTNMVQECDLRYCFGDSYGSCEINGQDFYTGNTDTDTGKIQQQLQPYGMEAFKELTGSCILDLRREVDLYAQTYTQTDNFTVQNCFASETASAQTASTPAPTQEAAGQQGATEYYATMLNHQTGGLSENGQYWMPGATQVEYNADADTITFYASFSKSNSTPFEFSEENFVEYGQRTFQLTSDTEYYGNEQDDYYPWTKESAVNGCVRLNGLQVLLKVVDGKVETMTFYS